MRARPTWMSQLYPHSFPLPPSPSSRPDPISSSLSVLNITDSPCSFSLPLTSINRTDHSLASSLSDSRVPTAASYPAKGVLDGTVHQVDSGVISPESETDDGGAKGPKGEVEGMDKKEGEGDGGKITVSMDGGHAQRRDAGH